MTEALALTDANFDKIVDELGKKLDLAPVNLQRGTYVENSLASGALALDLILGGGWPGGRWSGAVGGEGSGKSTLSFFAMAAATRQHVPVFHFDAEGAADPSYMQRIGLQTDWRAEQAAGKRAMYRPAC
jgi:RecA/RadA recombinase